MELNGERLASRLAFSTVTIAAMIGSWLTIIYHYPDWLSVYEDLLQLLEEPLMSPTFSVPLGLPLIIIAFIQAFLIGAALIRLSDGFHHDYSLRLAASLGLGLGICGAATTILGILQLMTPFNLRVATLTIVAACLSLSFYAKRVSPRSFLAEVVGMLVPRRRMLTETSSLKYTPFIALTLLIFYSGLMEPILHWDATVYHAVIAKLLLSEGGFPYLVGSSHGLELSSNYPPLASAIGAYFYAQVGVMDDFYFRLISPLASLLTLICIYELGVFLKGPRLGFLASFIALSTPLFILYSIYETNYMLLAFYSSATMLFALHGLSRGGRGPWLLSGTFCGFALLTSYHGVFALAPLVLAVLFRLRRSLDGLWSLPPLTLITSTWLARNLVLIGDPVYPFLSRLLKPNQFLEATLSYIASDSLKAFFGYAEPSPWDYLIRVFLNILHFPTYSALLFLGLLLIAIKLRSWKWLLVLAWPTIPLLLALTGLIWIFPRYFLLTIPGFSLITAAPLALTFSWMERFQPSVRDGLKISFALMLLLFTAYPALPYALTGKNAIDAGYVPPPKDPLYYFKRPGLAVPSYYHGQVKETWRWLEDRISEQCRLATMDSRLYYLKEGNPKYFLMLDGREAWPLYFVDDPKAVSELLASLNVTYIYDSPAGRIPLWSDLPLTMYLGSPYLPEAYNPLPNGVAGTIYSVGYGRPPVVDENSLPIAFSYLGWRWNVTDSYATVSTISELEDRALSDLSWLSIATPTVVNLTITYLDRGVGHDDINYLNKYANRWIEGYHIIRKSGTDSVATTSLILLPCVELGYVNLGLHSHRDPLTILKLHAEPLEVDGRCFYTNLTGSFTNQTSPPTLTIYLPLLEGGERLSIWAESHGAKVSLEIFEGVVYPWERTGWWLNHSMLARDPELPVMGGEDPSIVGWKAPADVNFVTAMAVLWDEYTGDERLDLTLEIGDARTFTTRPLPPNLLIRRSDVFSETLITRSSTKTFTALTVTPSLYNDATVVENLTLSLFEETCFLNIKVYDLKSLSLLDPPSGLLYRAVYVEASQGLGERAEVANLTATIKVDLDWLRDQCVNLEDLNLYVYNDGWRRLEPADTYRANGYLYFKVNLPSNTVVAVVARFNNYPILLLGGLCFITALPLIIALSKRLYPRLTSR